MLCVSVDAVATAVAWSSPVACACMVEWDRWMCVRVSLVLLRFRECERVCGITDSRWWIGASWSVMGESSKTTCVVFMLCSLSLCVDVASRR